MFRSNHSPLEFLRLKRSDSSPVFSQKTIDESNNNVSYQRESSVSPSPSLKSSRRKMDFASSSSLSDSIPANQQRIVSEEQQSSKTNSTIGQQAAAAAARAAATDPNNGAFTQKSSLPNYQHNQYHQNQSPVPHKRMLRHQRSLTDDGNSTNLSNDANKRTTHNINNNIHKQQIGENDGTGDDCLSECTSQTSDQSAHPHYQHQNSNQSSPGHSHSQHQSPYHSASKSNLSLLSGSRESNLNTIVHPLVNGIGQRPPAIRSNSSSSSLFTNSSPPNSSSLPGSKEDRKERRISGSERNRPRRGAMVSCENLLADSSELFSPIPESTLKNLKNSSRKIYRSGGGIFSNPFKSDTEKMEQLTELLRQYRENGIPDPKHYPMSAGGNGNNSKFNHLRASSLSISGILGPTAGATTTSNTPVSSGSHSTSSSLLSTTKTSLSTTDLHHMNHSSTPHHLQQHHHNHHNNNQTNNAPFNLTTLGQNCGQILSSSSFDASYDANYYLEPEWRSIVENSDRLPGRVQSQNEAIWELLQTEVFYIRRLKVMSETFIACLLSLQNECLLNEIDARSVFSNIGEIFDANHHFWMNYLMPMLNHSRENKCPLNPSMLEEGFTQIFRPYNQFCLEQSSCLQYLKDKRKSSALFKAYILWCENHKDCERLRLIDLLVMPMQRLTKYSLLLKAILKKTDNEAHKEALKRMELCVDNYVTGVNASMFQQQEHEKLSAVVGRIESYDAVDCNNDEAEKFLKDYLVLDLMQSMPGCAAQNIRHLYLEDTLKLKDAQSNKIDVHCFLFTDIFLVCKALNKKSIDSKIKVIRQPFITDRLIVRELKDGSGFVMIYLNELHVASTLILLYTPETRTWVDTIRKAQDDYRKLKYSSEQEFATYHANFDEDEAYETGHGLLAAASPRSSSRSSLIHSHSGSQDISEQASMHGHGHAASGPHSVINNNQLAIQQQPPRAISFELGDLRNPSLIVEDTDSFARSQSMDNRSPVVTVTSPRPERRAFLLRNNGKNSSSSNLSSGASSASSSISQLNQNSLSVSVPCPPQTFLPVQPHPRSGRRSASNSPQNVMPDSSFPNADQLSSLSPSQISTIVSHSPSTIQVSVHPPPPLSPPPPLPPLSPKKVLNQRNTSRPLPPLPFPSQVSHPTPQPPPPPPFPPSLLSISSRSQPSNPMTMTINKPPLVKTKNVSCGVASLSYATEKIPGHVHPVTQVYNKSPIEDNSQALNDEIEEDLNQMKNNECNEEYLKNRCSQQQKRTCRPDRRYHTADSIEHLKKEKDTSIHKRLSWNYGQQNSSPNQPSSTSYSPHCSHHHCASCSHQCGSGNQLLHPRPLASSNHSNKCLSNESVYSSSGFSSTGSVPLSVGSTENNCEQSCGCCGATCLELQNSHFDEEEEEAEHLAHQYSINQGSNVCSDRDSALPASPALNQSLPTCYHAHSNSQCSMESSSSAPDDAGIGSLPSRRRPSSTSSSSDIKIDVSEVKDGISSVQITLSGGAESVTRPTKSDLRKMKEFLLSNCNVESSDV